MEDVQKQLGDFIFAILEKIDEAGGREVMAEKLSASVKECENTSIEPTGNQAVAAALANLIAQQFTVLPR